MKKTSTMGVAKFGLALVLGASLFSTQTLLAEDHLVSPSDMQQDMHAASQVRQQNEQQLRSFLSTAEAQRAIKAAKMDPQQVTNAVGQLSNDDLSRLAARSAAAQKDFAAGRIDDHDLLVILVCVAVLILVVVAVH